MKNLIKRTWIGATALLIGVIVILGNVFVANAALNPDNPPDSVEIQIDYAGDLLYNQYHNGELQKDLRAKIHKASGEWGYCIAMEKSSNNGTAQKINIKNYLPGDELVYASLAKMHIFEDNPKTKDLSKNEKYALTQCMIWWIQRDHILDGGWRQLVKNGSLTEAQQKKLFDDLEDQIKKEASDYKGIGLAYRNIDVADDQEIGFIFYPEQKKGKVKLKKASTVPAISDGNNCYSLKDAVYGVYSDSKCTKKVGELKTDDKGSTNTLEMTAGNYWVKELTKPEGFELDTQIYPVVINAGETATVSAKDKPGNDPFSIQLEKLDKETGAIIQGGASLAGAQFTIKYYDGFYTASDLPETAKRTWVVETKEKKYEDGSVHYIAALSNEYKVSGDEFYTDGGKSVLPYGTLSVEETKAPEGYLLEDSYLQPADGGDKVEGIYVAQIKAQEGGVHLNGGNVYTMTDKVIRGGVEIQKRDLETGDATPQGGATLEGAKFDIINLNEHAVIVEGKSYASGQVVMTLTTDKEGKAKTAADCLPYGDYKIIERNAPEGYHNSGTIERTFSIHKEGEIVSLTDQGSSILNQIIRGGVKVQKRDLDTGGTTPQGMATLEGAKFDIINLNKNAVLVEGKSYGPGKVVKTLTTDKEGKAGTSADCLPYGDYKISESSAPEGYLNKGTIERPFSIHREGEIIDLTGKDNAILNQVIRGGVRVQKRDLQSMDAHPEGGAKLEGAKFAITTVSKNFVVVDGKVYEKGQVVKTIVTNEKGIAETSADCLPYGDYTLKEVSPPEGYLAKGVLERSFSIREDGKIVELTDKETSIINLVKRGDLEFIKIEAKTHKRMANVPFRITSKTTNESHIAVTDDNGYFTTESAVYAHSSNTNGNDGHIEDEAFDFSAGTWFGLNATGENVAVDDELGALPYDTYLVEELRCKANEKNELVPAFEVKIYADKRLVKLGTVTDEKPEIPEEPEIHTTAVNKEDGSKTVKADEEVTIVDTVTLKNLKAGTKYQLKGWQMLKDENSELQIDEKRVENTAEFTADAENMEVQVAFTFDTSALGGSDLVTFEELYDITDPENPEKIAEHKDIGDEGQTVTVEEPEPELEIHTTAVNKEDGGKAIPADGKVTILDTVTLKGLTVDTKYQLKGWQMLKDENAELQIDGRRVENTKEFTADAEDMEVQIEFTFDASSLGGSDLVTFEELYDVTNPDEPEKAVEHKDIEDEGQTVHVEEPKHELEIHTTATNKEDGGKTVKADGKVTIVDTVVLKGLSIGTKYQLKGWQMLKDEETELQINGKPMENVAVFTAETKDMEVQMEFTFDASALGGSELVTFEELYDLTNPDEPKKVSEHKDIEDEGQTVHVEEPGIQIHTNATNKTDESKIVKSDDKVTIVDTVTLEGLEIGKEYKLSGWQMLKSENAELKIDGNRVENDLTFTADANDMEVQIEFTFNASALGGSDLVTFEELYDMTEPEKPEKVAEHKDIEDEGQTVFVNDKEIQIHTNATNKADGSKTLGADGKVTVVDTITLEGLEVGKEYKLSGWQMLKAENAELKIDGKRVENDLTFTAEETNMEVQIEFTFNASALNGSDLVTFEELYDITEPEKPEKVAVHKDIEDEAQTVSVPDKPETPSTDNPKVSSPVKTGDNAPLLLYGIIALISLLAATGLGIFLYKRRNNRN